MKTYLIIITNLLLTVSFIHAQAPVTQIEGRMELYHPEDETSIYIGKNAGLSTDNTGPGGNTYLGFEAGFWESTGYFNSFFGRGAGRQNTTGNQNCFFGSRTGDSNSSGFSNSFFGTGAGGNTSIGFANCFFGRGAGYLNTSGDKNVFIGNDAGRIITAQNEIIAIGNNAGPETLGIGEHSRLFIDVEQTNNPLIYGEFDNNLLRVNGTLQVGARNYNGSSSAGVLRAPPLFDADLYIVSPDNVYIEIGENAGQSGTFEIWNGPDLSSTTLLQTAVFRADEPGNVSAAGAINGSSDINRKETFKTINTRNVLDKISVLPITKWQYKGSTERHIGRQQ